MVAIRDLAILVAATAASGAAATKLANPIHAVAYLQGRDATVTVTVTETTCPDQGSTIPPGVPTSTVPGETPATSVATETPTLPTGGYTSPPLTSDTIGTGSAPPATETPPLSTSVPGVLPPVSSSATPPVVSTATTESVPVVNTTPTAGSSSESVPTTHTSGTTSVTTSHASTTSSATSTVSIPPAVNGASVFKFDAGVLAALAVAMLC